MAGLVSRAPGFPALRTERVDLHCRGECSEQLPVGCAHTDAVLRMPLHGDRERQAWIFQSLDDAVGGYRGDNQCLAKPGGGLMMPGVHFVLARADDRSQACALSNANAMGGRMLTLFGILGLAAMNFDARQMLDQRAAVDHIH